ncbi:MAG: winged-helix phosphate transcriptional response regulator [Myxococcales bacterium]|nr:winged-helix phosphate transcriptional response regulator [Myxococcales bacterium]
MAGYVLIVESDPELQRRIGDALREGRYELASEAEAKWAARSVAVRAPDALVIDTKLSDGDGFALAEILRRDPDTRDAPILFIATSHRGASHRAEARRRFAPADYLSTPLDANSLLAAMLRALPPEGRLDAGAGAHATLAPPPPIDQPDVGHLVAALDGVLRDPEQQRERRSVERTAKSLAGEKAELQGTLRRIPFARLLRRLYEQKATGSLLLLRDAAKKDATKKIVMFVDGYPTSVKSNVLAECLGQILVDRKLISDKALSDSLARMKTEKRQQGQILVEMGALSPHNLQRALVEQVETKLLEVFEWPDGKFMFKEGDTGESGVARRLERPPAALILEGIRRHYDEARQRAVLDAYVNQPVALSPDPVLRLQDVTTDPAVLAYINSIDGNESLEEVLGRAPIARAEARLLLVALAEAGMITHAEGPSARRRGTPGVAGLTLSPPQGVVAAVSPPQQSGPLSGGQLSMVAETVRTQDFFWSLGIERDATPADIDRAYDAHARTFHPDRYRHSTDEDRKMAQEIFERLGEAHRTLREPQRRRTYIARLDRGAVATPDSMERAGEITTGVDLVSPPPMAAPTLASNAAARALYEAGREHLRTRRHHEAVEAFRQAARLVPNEAEFRASLGWALFREAPADARAGRAALAELRRAVQLDPRNRRAAEYLAQIHAQTGQPELAIQELERLLSHDPTATEAAEELRRLRGES